MDGITSAEAIARLQSNPGTYSTPEALRALANEVSIGSASGKSLLYSGNIGDYATNDIVQVMSAQGDDIRIVNDSPVAKLLTSDNFIDAVAEAFREDADVMLKAKNSPAYDFLFKATLIKRPFQTDQLLGRRSSETGAFRAH